MRKLTALAACCSIALSVAQAARADLASYLARPEPSYHWEKTGEKKIDGATIYQLKLVSQTWHGIIWDHRLNIYRPDNLAHPHFCALFNTGNDDASMWDMYGPFLAKESGACYAVLFDNPKQPVFGGLTEDGITVYTWKKYLETHDDTWPLHMPMAKAVMKALDTVEAFSVKENLPKIDSFLVTGGSKRGWSAWLAGASRDPRVKAIAPMVIDMLHLTAQIPQQVKAYGAPSEAIHDFTSSGVLDALKTPDGQKLIQIEDPWYYRSVITMPKLIILGTNDPYWQQDALNVYWDDLLGKKWISYTPNSGHGLNDRMHAFHSLIAFIHAIAGQTAWPKMSWRFTESPADVSLAVHTSIKAKAGRLFRVFAPTRDFRKCHWDSEPMQATGDGFTGRLEKPATGFAATFGELEYEIDGKTFTLSTQMHILSRK